MRVLLVTTANKLAEKFAALSLKLEYCAVVTDNVNSAKEILPNVGLSPDLLRPMSELKTCLESLQYDYVLCVQDGYYDGRLIANLQKCNVPTEKVISFAQLPDASKFYTERFMRYFREHSQEFEIFSTGTSYTMNGIDVRQFKRKAINFALSSQDLYYNFLVAKSVILCGGGIVRYVMLLSVLLPILFTSIFPRRLH